MLRFVFGRNGSGKTEYVRKLLSEKLLAGEKGLILIVPEQFSFETERAMLEKVGPKNMLNLEILSFSRLAETVLSQFAPGDKPKIDDGTRAVLMSLALEALGENAEIYKKFINRPALLQSLVTFSTELKQCAVSTDALEKAGETLPEGTLKHKLSELSKITDLYNALVHDRFSDDTDLLTRLAEIIPEIDYFDCKTVVLDTFCGFTKQERNVIAAMLRRCKDVYITLCMDETKAADTLLFDNIRDEVEKLKRVCAEISVPVAKPVVCVAAEDTKTPELHALEENIFRSQKEKFADAPAGLQIFSAANRADESDFVAREIRKLLREKNYRAGEIAVIERKKDTYDHELNAAFQKFGLPFFEDKRQPVNAQPLMQMISGLLDMAADGITTEVLLRYLKTGIAGLTADEAADLENYAVMWNIDRAKWRSDFTGNPAGLGQAMQEREEKKLAQLNELRRRAVGPVLAFRKEFEPASGLQKSRMLYDFLQAVHAGESLKALAQQLAFNGQTAVAEQQNTVWEMLMDMLDKLALAIGESVVSAKRYRELFSVLLGCVDLGQIPQGLDVITVGAADRIRIAPPRAVFVVGANSGSFPQTPPTDGILSDAERKTLESFGVQLTETAEVKAVDEYFYAYYAMTLPREKLTVSYALADYKGAGLAPSEIVTELQEIFPQIPVTDSHNLLPQERVESAADAFETMAAQYAENTALSASLVAYFRAREDYQAREAAVRKAVLRIPAAFADASVSERLFGKDMLISASKAEVYYKCPFSYFCKYGLKLKPLKKAELDFAQSGTFLHYCLEKILSANERDALRQMPDDELRGKIRAVLEEYTEQNLGGSADKEPRFLYLLQNLCETAFDVLQRLIAEFSVSAFIPTDFELSIGPDGDIEPYRLPLADGGSLRIIGSVDRVDVMQKDGKSYLRVIDYKSGGKKFKLSEVLSGLNMQMLIYLFAICENGTERYGEMVPAGVLYLPAKSVEDKLSRNADDQEILEARLEKSRMDGVVLENVDVILGMDSTASGHFIPVTKKGETFTGHLLNSKVFSSLKQRVDFNLQEMASKLHKGDIPVLPTYSEKKNVACTYCDYKAICGYEDGDTIREVQNLGRFEAVRNLLEEEEAK